MPKAKNSSGYCSGPQFDKKTKTATFTVYINQWQNKKIATDKFTFRLNEFLSGCSEFEGELTDLDLSNLPTSPKTQKVESFRGSGDYWGSKEYGDYVYLMPNEDGICSPVDGVKITGIGFIEGKLRIQIYFENSRDFGDHGSISVVDKNGNHADNFVISYWDKEHKGGYDEIFYDITPDKLPNYKAFGTFITCKGRTEGPWSITFPLRDK